MGFAKNLQEIRKKNGLTQEDLAEMLGVSRQAVSKWEQGEGYPEVEKLIIISSKLGISLDSLMGISQPSQPEGKNRMHEGCLTGNADKRNTQSVQYGECSEKKHLNRKSKMIIIVSVLAVLIIASVLIIALCPKNTQVIDNEVLNNALYFELVPVSTSPESVIYCRKGDPGFDEIVNALRALKGHKVEKAPGIGLPISTLGIYTKDTAEFIMFFNSDKIVAGSSIYKIRGVFTKDDVQQFFPPKITQGN